LGQLGAADPGTAIPGVGKSNESQVQDVEMKPNETMDWRKIKNVTLEAMTELKDRGLPHEDEMHLDCSVRQHRKRRYSTRNGNLPKA